MGKRKKTSRGPKKKLVLKLDTQFSCLFCNHEKSVICNMDKKLGIGSLYCKICGQTFQAPINVLSAPIDVYSEWIDACEAVAEETQETGGSRYSDRERDDVRQSGGESEQDDYDEY